MYAKFGDILSTGGHFRASYTNEKKLCGLPLLNMTNNEFYLEIHLNSYDMYV